MHSIISFFLESHKYYSKKFHYVITLYLSTENKIFANSNNKYDLYANKRENNMYKHTTHIEQKRVKRSRWE